MIKQGWKKILLVLLLGAVVLAAGNVGATPLHQDATIYGYDSDTNKKVQLDFAIYLYDGVDWNGANGVTVAANKWIYTYQIYSAPIAGVTGVKVNNLTLDALVEGFQGAGAIGNKTSVSADPDPNGLVNWVFTFNGGLGAGDTSDLLYLISNSNYDPYLSKDLLKSAPVLLFAGLIRGTGLLPAPGDIEWSINASVNPVPEPATLLLVGSAMLIGAASRAVRRKKRI